MRTDLHTVDGAEAVLEDVLFVLEEGEALRTFLNLHLRALFVFGDNKPTPQSARRNMQKVKSHGCDGSEDLIISRGQLTHTPT